MTDLRDARPPVRLIDDPEASDPLRAALLAGRAEAPSPEQLAALSAAMGRLLTGGGGGGAATSAATKTGTSLAAKLGGAAALAAGGAIVIALVLGRPDASAPHRPGPAAPADEVASPAPLAPTTDLPDGVDPPDRAVEPAAHPGAPSRPRHERDPAAELALIQRAQSALQRTPSDALRLTQAHERRFGPGALAQEREVIAIDALRRLGRATAAHRRADRFLARWPRSAHARRVEVMLREPL